jgi:hypothetical protein
MKNPAFLYWRRISRSGQVSGLPMKLKPSAEAQETQKEKGFPRNDREAHGMAQKNEKKFRWVPHTFRVFRGMLFDLRRLQAGRTVSGPAR